MNMKIFWNSESIKAARTAKRLSQAQLSILLGCRQQTVSEWETGKYLPKNAYQRILTMFFNHK